MNTSLTLADLGAPLSPAQARAWLGLLATHAGITRRIDASLRAKHHLGLTAYEIMLQLAQAPACQLRMSELAAGGPLTLSGVSRMVDRLERDGLVRREATTEDRRVARATLTQAGVERLRAAHQTYTSAIHRLFLDHLSEQEIATLGACWERLSGHPPASD